MLCEMHYIMYVCIEYEKGNFMYVCMYGRIYVYMYVCMYVCMYVSMYKY